jgi:phenylacetate-CoA ligase
MPLLRYQIGDRGTLTSRSDGQQVLESVLGREVDAFRRTDGALIDGEYFTHLLYFKPWARQFQFVQTHLDSLVVKVVLIPAAPRPPTAEVEGLNRDIRKVLGAATSIDWEWVDAIPPLASGKFRYTMSLVPPPCAVQL